MTVVRRFGLLILGVMMLVVGLVLVVTASRQARALRTDTCAVTHAVSRITRGRSFADDRMYAVDTRDQSAPKAYSPVVQSIVAAYS